MASNERTYKCQVVLNEKRSTVFNFFSDAQNLENMTPPLLRFKILSQSTEEIQEGCLFEYSLRVHGIPIRWKTEILEWKPNEGFVDNQIKGPYKKWYHFHGFEDHPDGTLMTDEVTYALHFGFLGQLVAGRFVSNDVAKIFDYRTNEMLRRFGGKKVL